MNATAMYEDIDEDIPSIVAEEIGAAQRAGIPPQEQAAYVAERLRFRIAGTVQYVRKNQMSARQRCAEIRRLFNGCNKRELAKQFGLTQRRIGQIVGGG